MNSMHRLVIAMALLQALSACQAINPFNTMKTAVLAGSERPEQAPSFREMPYGQVRVRINGGPTGRMLLARNQAGVQQLLAADGKALWLREGRIVASRGLRDDLHALHALDTMPAPATVAQQPQAEPTRFAVYSRSAQEPDVGLVLEYTLRKGEDSLAFQLGGAVRRLQRVEEHVYHPVSDEQWTNEYWVDTRSGRILISSQKLPGTPYRVRLEANIDSRTARDPKQTEKPRSE